MRVPRHVHRESARTLLILGMFLLVGLWARLIDLSGLSLWADEGYSYDIARRGPVAILSLLSTEDRHPPLHYLLLWLTMRLAGSSEFVLRFVSAAIAVLALPLVFTIGRKVGGRNVGLVAMSLLTIAPFHIWYGREARMYALLATLGLLSVALWLGLIARLRLDPGHVPLPRGELNSRPLGLSRDSWLLLSYALATAGMLYSHYYGIFIVVAEILALPLLVAPRLWVRPFLGLTAAGLFFAPWLPSLIRQIGRQASAGYAPDRDVFTILWDLAAAFTLGDSFTPPSVVIWIAIVLAAIGFIAPVLAWLFDPAPQNRDTSDDVFTTRLSGWRGSVFLALWLLVGPLIAYGASAFFGMEVRATGRMYYIASQAALLLLVARGVVWLYQFEYVPAIESRGRRLSGAGLVLAVVAPVALISTGLLFGGELTFARRQQAMRTKEDYRTAAKLIESSLWPGDIVLTVAEPIFRTQPIGYYFNGSAPLQRIDLETADFGAALRRQLQGHSRAWLVFVHESVADPDDRVGGWFAANATPVEDLLTEGYHLRLVNLESRPQSQAPPDIRPVNLVLADQVELVGANVALAKVGPDRVVHAKTVWRPLVVPTDDGHIAMLLTDAQGQSWKQVDRVAGGPLHDMRRWRVDDFVTDRTDLPVPEGLMPGTYRVQARLYMPSTGVALKQKNGEDLHDLGTVEIGATVLSVPKTGEVVAPGLILVASNVAANSVKPGDRLTVDVDWQSTAPMTSPQPMRLVMTDVQGQNVLDVPFVPGGNTWPISKWERGTFARERLRIDIPRRLNAGTYSFAVISGERRQPIGAVAVATLPRVYAAPPMSFIMEARLADIAELIGYDIPNLESTPGGTARVSLYWRALTDPMRDYTVFTHLVGPDVSLFGQKDNPPMAGRYPTTFWVRGKIVRDNYEIAINSDAPIGLYKIVVGMYRPDTGERFPSTTGDSITLPTTITLRR